MASILIFLLCLAIFCAAAFFVMRLIPEPFQKWAIAILVVLGAIFAINWLMGGGLGVGFLHR
jgi:hypothetical protein